MIRSYVVYCKDGMFLPKLYKSKGWAQKRILQQSTLTCQQFPTKEEGQLFLADKLAEAIVHRQHSKRNQTTVLPQESINSQQSHEGFHEQEKEGTNVGSALKDTVASGLDSRASLFCRLEERIRNNRDVKRYYVPGVQTSVTSTHERYIGYFDGCSRNNPGSSACSYLLRDRQRKKVSEQAVYLEHQTNNQAEFLGLIFLLLDAYLLHINYLDVVGDSQLVLQFMNRHRQISAWRLRELSQVALLLSHKFRSVTFHHVPRAHNAVADALANKAYSRTWQQRVNQLQKDFHRNINTKTSSTFPS